jgi:excisionase family DNA binding protein
LALPFAQVYELIRTGRLETVNEGRSRRIPAEAITEYVNLLKREAKEARSADAA